MKTQGDKNFKMSQDVRGKSSFGKVCARIIWDKGEHMINGCENCIAYLIHYGKSEPDPCLECGQKALIWKQNSFGTFYLECSNCGAEVAVDLNTPCELDSLMQQKIKIEIKSQEQLPNIEVIVKVGKCLKLNALDMRKKLVDGYELEIAHSEFSELISILNEAGIEVVVRQDENPTEKYPLFKECRYPYSPMRAYLKK